MLTYDVECYKHALALMALELMAGIALDLDPERN